MGDCWCSEMNIIVANRFAPRWADRSRVRHGRMRKCSAGEVLARFPLASLSTIANRLARGVTICVQTPDKRRRTFQNSLCSAHVSRLHGDESRVSGIYRASSKDAFPVLHYYYYIIIARCTSVGRTYLLVSPKRAHLRLLASLTGLAPELLAQSALIIDHFSTHYHRIRSVIRMILAW